MAAKKAPMRKPVTRKAPVKKVVAKKVASAADFRKKEEADKKKAKYPGAIINANKNQGEYSLSSGLIKAGKDARGRAAKYGKVVGRTRVDNSLTNQPGDLEVSSTSLVKSARGNYYRVTENKRQNMGARDTDRRTYISPSKANMNSRYDFKATGKRDAKFGPAPKAPKRKGK